MKLGLMEMKIQDKITEETAAALLIFIFAILYRVLLITADPYPPGPDLGLHASIINSILINGGKFTYNFYHMGGGDVLTHPGFHFFTATMLIFTGAPEWLMQSSIAVLFSSLTVLCAFLLTKEVWPLPAAPLIAAFLTAISKHDLDMLLWGGYPNVIALTLIPSVFFIFLKKDVSKGAFLTVASILIGTLIFTHSLSALIFMAILIPFILISWMLSKKSDIKIEKEEPSINSLLLATVLGLIFAFPFLIEALPVYLGNIRQGMFMGNIEGYKQAIILTRLIPLGTALLSLIPATLILLFSKKYRGAFLDRAGLLFSLWMVIPALSTQSYVAGLYTDFWRLLYFLVFPVIVFLALLFDHGFGFLASKIEKISKANRVNLNAKFLHSVFLTCILLISLFNVFPFFTGPDAEFVVANFYDTVSASDFDAIMWIRQNTPVNAVFVSQHGYGWWISGFGQRPTLSATEPQFLIVPHEFQAAEAAKNLLETNFILGNGLIQVREDGGYIGRYNPALMVNVDWSIEPVPILYFNESEITIFYRYKECPKIIDANQIPVKEVLITKKGDAASISIIKENNYLLLNRTIEILRGTPFAVYFISIESVSPSVSLEYSRIIIHGKGKLILNGETIGILNEWAHLCGELIFSGKVPEARTLSSESPNCLELIYAAPYPRKLNIEMTIGGYKTEKSDEHYIRKLLSDSTRSSWSTMRLNVNFSIGVWDYRDVIKKWGVDFIAFKRQEYPIKKFLNDPMFKLIFINDNVAIFRVREAAG